MALSGAALGFATPAAALGELPAPVPIAPTPSAPTTPAAPVLPAPPAVTSPAPAPAPAPALPVPALPAPALPATPAVPAAPKLVETVAGATVAATAAPAKVVATVAAAAAPAKAAVTTATKVAAGAVSSVKPPALPVAKSTASSTKSAPQGSPAVHAPPARPRPMQATTTSLQEIVPAHTGSQSAHESANGERDSAAPSFIRASRRDALAGASPAANRAGDVAHVGGPASPLATWSARPPLPPVPSERNGGNRAHDPAQPLPLRPPASPTALVGEGAVGGAGAAFLLLVCLSSFLWVAPPLRRWLRRQPGLRMLPAFVAPLERPG
jgi:hypothetical protein